ncbi:hypothetical protein NDU88_002970 [Pleurodeles waltl]|uniref:Uncharacterized protein n=1 Tax=Pleurodeles waltl TaxID=8319 RepID=A0AAV7RD07_PLEWA|nr:hypothetical protein NDU88_002970 [Pleurodeles waltl]
MMQEQRLKMGHFPGPPGGTAKSASPRSLYDFWIKNRKGENAEKHEEEDARRTKGAQEGAGGKTTEKNQESRGKVTSKKPERVEESNGKKGDDRHATPATFQEEPGCPRYGPS